jgi:glutamyl-tRNA reductase
MEQFGVVGASYRHAGVDEVARLSLDRASLAQRLPALREALAVAELVYLGTCNRVELLYVSGSGRPAADLRTAVLAELTGRAPQPEQAPRLLRAWAGESAVEHVLLVACGLDSAQAGEREIAAQLRLAWESAREAGTCGPKLDRLLGEALGMASRVQRLRSGLPHRSLADLAVDRVLAHLGGKHDQSDQVVLIGVSPMTRRCGLALARAGVTLLIVNRSLAAAESFAAEVSARVVTLETFRETPEHAAAMVLAAGGGAPLLGAATLERIAGRPGKRRPLAVDFGVPPNLEPAAAQRARIEYIGMNDLVRAVEDRRLDELLRLAPVRAAIDDRLARLRTEMASRAIGPHLAELRETFEHIAAEELERALASQLRTLDAVQQAAVRRLTERVAHSLVHLPIRGLRAAAAQTTADVLDTFFRAAQLQRRGPPGTTLPSEQADR